MSLLSSLGVNLLGGLAAKKAGKGQANELAAMSPFDPFQQRAMANLYAQRATEDPRAAAQRDVSFAQEAGKPRMQEMAEQFSRHVGQRMGTGAGTGQAGFTNELAKRQFSDVFRQGGLADLGAMQQAYANQLQALGGGLGMQQGYNQTLGAQAAGLRADSRMAIPESLAAGYGSFKGGQMNDAIRQYMMSMIPKK